MGKLLVDTMRRGRMERRGSCASLASRLWRIVRSAVRQARGRGVVMSWGSPLRSSESGGWNCGEHAAVVSVQRSAWERVTESEELVGRFKVGSRLPQYLLPSEKVQYKGQNVN